MTDSNTPDVSLPDDFAEFEAVRQGRAPSEDSKKESETADESETTEDQEPEAEEPETDEEEGEDGDEEEDDKPKSKRGITKRFRELTQKIRGLEARLQSTPEAKPEIAKPEAAAAPAGKPQASAYNTYEEYTEALTEWTLDQREIKREAEKKQREASDAWETKLQSARKLHKDFDKKVLENDKVEISGVMKQAIFELERGPEVAYVLAENPKEAKRIAQLSPTAAIRAIGKIEDGLTPLQKAPSQKTASKAPEPIEPVSRPAKVTPKKKPLGEVDDFEEYYRRRSAGER